MADDEEHPVRKMVLILLLLLRGLALALPEELVVVVQFFLIADEYAICYEELDAFIPDRNVWGKPGLFPV